MKNYAFLVQVDALKNHNKYYKMVENDDGSIDVNYGRVGGRDVPHHYNSWEKNFFDLKESKIAKGYVDETALHFTVEEKKNTDLTFSPIEIKEINDLIEELIKQSREFMKKNYTVTANEVTPKMIAEAVADIEELNYIAENSLNALPAFNEKLQELFSDIPRRMPKVADYLAKSSADFSKIIKREQEMLDNIKGQVVAVKNPVKRGEEETALEAYGLKVTPISYKEEDQIIAHLGKDYGKNSKNEYKAMEDRYITSYKVENLETREKYEGFKKDYHIKDKDVKLFYHGSRTENWWSIMKTGLSLNPNAITTGKMFGNGLYFASDFRKSANYTSARGSHWTNGSDDHGYVAVYAVGLGKCYKPNSSLSASFNKNNLPSGCLSVYADKHLTGLKNDEYVVYRPEQCTIKYLVKIADGYAREKNFTLDRKAIRNDISKGFTELIKTPKGFKAEIQIDAVSDKCRNELLDKICYAHDADRLFIEYNSKTDKAELTAITSNEDSITINSLTYDDLQFLSRELKKSFAESEHEWKNLCQKLSSQKTGSRYSKEGTDKVHKSIERE